MTAKKTNIEWYGSQNKQNFLTCFLQKISTKTICQTLYKENLHFCILRKKPLFPAIERKHWTVKKMDRWVYAFSFESWGKSQERIREVAFHQQ